MKMLDDISSLYKAVIENINSSFIIEFFDIYFITQIYLKSQNELKEIDLAYLKKMMPALPNLALYLKMMKIQLL